MGKQSRLRGERRLGPKPQGKKRQPYVVALRVELTFSEQEREALMKFQSLLNSEVEAQMSMSIENICKQSIFYSISDAYRKGREMAAAKKEAEDGQPQSGDLDLIQSSKSGELHGVTSGPFAKGDSATVSSSQDVNSTVLAEQTSGGDTVAAE